MMDIVPLLIVVWGFLPLLLDVFLHVDITFAQFSIVSVILFGAGVAVLVIRGMFSERRLKKDSDFIVSCLKLGGLKIPNNQVKDAKIALWKKP